MAVPAPNMILIPKNAYWAMVVSRFATEERNVSSMRLKKSCGFTALHAVCSSSDLSDYLKDFQNSEILIRKREIWVQICAHKIEF